MFNTKLRRAVIAVGAVVGLSGLLFAAHTYRVNNTPVVSVDFIMDTVVEQKLYGKNAKAAVDDINSALRAFENRFSMYRENSEIVALNKLAGTGQGVSLSEEAYALLKRSKLLSQQSHGAFDLTIAPLTSVWGITSDNPHVPSNPELEEAKALVNWEDLLLDDETRTARLLHTGQAVDLGGIAKGAACDIVTTIAQKYGITKGYASIGGNMVVLGGKPAGRDLNFGIRDPQGDASDAIGAVTLYNKTMATTGGYERFFEENGVVYHHVLDPQTGRPADSDFLSVSVISEDGTLADFLSTTLFILGKEAVLDCLDRTDFQVIAVGKDDVVYCSKELEGKILPVKDGRTYKFVYGG